ncbi:MAG: stage II sporulation protein R [Bacilli bacterium]|nr:stage II sporulation protein R [Bacilli bacterium]MDD4808640.1 stage II sporulation protein R [Bacilli bacterium]
MRKSILFILGMLMIYLLLGNIYTNKIVIPDEAIRLRVIPHSNNKNDQMIKQQVSILLQDEMYHLLKNTTKIEEARSIINNNLDKLDMSINNLLTNKKYPYGYQVNFGYNYFPEKEYNDIIYNEGYYESLLVTLGNGSGDNWWCVLFPPLCLLEGTESNTIEYKFFIKEIIDKYF